jgi:hypothetical protein
MAYQQTVVPLKDKDGNTVNVLTASGDGINPTGNAVVKVDPAIGSISDSPITDPNAVGTLQAIIRGVLQITKTFDTRMTSITREKAVLQVGGGNNHSALSTAAITGPAVRIHSVSGLSYGLTTMLGVGAASPVYLLLVAPINSSFPPVVPTGMLGLNINPSVNTTNYRIFAPPILLRGTDPETATITTDARDQFELKTIGAEYFGLNGMLAPFGFAFIASSTPEKFTPPVNYNFFAQCQITGV